MRPDWDEMWNQRQIPKQISVDFQQKPFWSAMLELCEQTKVGFSPHGNPGEIRLSNHRQFSGKTVKEGAFTIVATNASRRMSVNYGSEQTPQNNLNLQFYVLPDPSLEVISGRQLMTVLEAIDADGKSLKRDSDQYGDMYSRQIAWNSNASLDPNTTAKSLKSFKGLTRFTVVTESETLEVPDILNAKDVTKAAAWRTVTVKELKKIDHGYQLSISYQTTGTPDNDLANAAQPSNIQLLDADGNAYVANGYSGGGNSRTGMNYEITFIDPASRRGGNAPSVKEPAKLVWQIPTKSRGLVVTFEMNDMPLP
jgi:hypothetical protein